MVRGRIPERNVGARDRACGGACRRCTAHLLLHQEHLQRKIGESELACGRRFVLMSSYALPRSARSRLALSQPLGYRAHSSWVKFLFLSSRVVVLCCVQSLRSSYLRCKRVVPRWGTRGGETKFFCRHCRRDQQLEIRLSGR